MMGVGAALALFMGAVGPLSIGDVLADPPPEDSGAGGDTSNPPDNPPDWMNEPSEYEKFESSIVDMYIRESGDLVPGK